VTAVGWLAWAARAAGAPRTQWVGIALAALVLMIGHPAPFGTVAFGCLVVAALSRELHRPAFSGGRAAEHTAI
jgi:hypothetical protein